MVEFHVVGYVRSAYVNADEYVPGVALYPVEGYGVEDAAVYGWTVQGPRSSFSYFLDLPLFLGFYDNWLLILAWQIYEVLFRYV